jgi:hypothetical protein
MTATISLFERHMGRHLAPLVCHCRDGAKLMGLAILIPDSLIKVFSRLRRSFFDGQHRTI